MSISIIMQFYIEAKSTNKACRKLIPIFLANTKVFYSSLRLPNIFSLNRNTALLLFFFFFCQLHEDGRIIAILCEVSSEISIIG